MVKLVMVVIGLSVSMAFSQTTPPDLQQEKDTVQILYDRARLDYNRCQQDYAELVLMARKINAENEKLKEGLKEVKK